MPKYWGSTRRTRAHRALLETLIEVRVGAGLSQRDLAERLELPRSYVSKIETGERRVDPVECVAWAEACGAKPLGFFRRLLQALRAASTLAAATRAGSLRPGARR